MFIRPSNSIFDIISKGVGGNDFKRVDQNNSRVLVDYSISSYRDALIAFKNKYAIQFRPLWNAYQDMDTSRVSFIIENWLKDLNIVPNNTVSRGVLEQLFITFPLIKETDSVQPLEIHQEPVAGITFVNNGLQPSFIAIGSQEKVLCESVQITEKSMIFYFDHTNPPVLTFNRGGVALSIEKCTAVEILRDGSIGSYRQKQ